MQTKLDTKKIITIVAIFLGTGLLLSLIPIIISSFYSHPLADDFGFSEKVNHVVKNGGGLFDILSASFQQVKDTYLDWQGTYAAIFVFSLQPAAFSEHIYFLTTFVMLTALIASTLFFVNTIFNILGYDKKIGIIISFVILLLSIHFVVDKKEAFFWWNGSSYYTLFYSFSLLFFSILIKLYYAEKIIKKVIFLIISLLLAAILGGGNYSTALLTTVILAFVMQGLSYIFKFPLQSHCIQTFRLWTWLQYFILGGLIGKNHDMIGYIKNITFKKHTVILFIITGVIPWYQNFIGKLVIHNSYAEYFYDSLLTILWIIVLFTWVMKLSLKQWVIKIIKYIAPVTMGVYIIHPIIIMFALKIVSVETVLTSFAFFGIVLVVAFFIAKIIYKIPKVIKFIEL